MSKEYSLEDEVKGNEYICNKIRTNTSYAQNFYAALCNNEFLKLKVLPILKDEYWSCSWRYAGGIIADIREEGDYMDWYCSGVTMSSYIDADGTKVRAVSESVITCEVRQDIEMLGWRIIEDDE